jgi:hypothetical protein
MSRTVAPYADPTRRTSSEETEGTGGTTVFHTGYQPAGAPQQRSQAPHRRSRGVPQPPALLRLAGAVLVEAHDEWQATDRRYLSEATTAQLTTPAPQEGLATPELLTA